MSGMMQQPKPATCASDFRTRLSLLDGSNQLRPKLYANHQLCSLDDASAHPAPANPSTQEEHSANSPPTERNFARGATLRGRVQSGAAAAVQSAQGTRRASRPPCAMRPDLSRLSRCAAQ